MTTVPLSQLCSTGGFDNDTIPIFTSVRRGGTVIQSLHIVSYPSSRILLSTSLLEHPMHISICICLKRIVLVILPRIPFRSILGWGRRFIPEIIRFIIWNPVGCYGNILNSLSCGKIKHIAAWIYYKTKLEFSPLISAFLISQNNEEAAVIVPNMAVSAITGPAPIAPPATTSGIIRCHDHKHFLVTLQIIHSFQFLL